MQNGGIVQHLVGTVQTGSVTVAPTWTTTPQPGSKLYVSLVLANANNANPTFGTTPTGWTLDDRGSGFTVQFTSGVNRVWMNGYYRTAGSTTGSDNFSMSVTNNAGGGVIPGAVEMWGTDPNATPVTFAVGTATGANLAPTIGTTSPSQPCIVIGSLGMRGAGIGSATWGGGLSTLDAAATGGSYYLSLGWDLLNPAASLTPTVTASDTSGQGAGYAIGFPLAGPQTALILPTAATQRAANR